MKNLKNHPAVYLISTITALTLFGDSLLYSVLPLYAEQLAIPLMAVGVILSLNRWVRLLTNPISAKVFRRLGLFRPLLTVVILTVFSTLLYSRPWGLIVFLFARAIWGLCWSHLRLGSFMIILGTSSSTLGLAIGTHHAVTRLGSAFTTLFGGILIDLTGYQMGLTIMAILTSLAIPLVFALRPLLANDRLGIDAVPEHQTQKSSIRPPELSPMLCNIAAFANSLVGAGIIVSSLSLILNQRIGDSVSLGMTTIGIATISGTLFAIRWTSNMLFSPIVGRLTDIYGRRRAFLLLAGMMALFLFVFGVVTNWIITIIVACLLFFAGNALEVVLDAAISDTTHNTDSTNQLSRYASFYDFGAACGPIIGYFLGVKLGFAIPYYVGSSIMVILIVLYFSGVFRAPQSKFPKANSLPD